MGERTEICRGFPAEDCGLRADRGLEAAKKSGLSQALAKRSLIREDLGDARLTVPAFFHSFPAVETGKASGGRLAESHGLPMSWKVSWPKRVIARPSG